MLNWAMLVFAILTALSRVLIPIPNFSAVLGFALFVGFRSEGWKSRISFPLLGLIMGDLLLALSLRDWEYVFHSTMWVVYASVLLCMLVGLWVERKMPAGFFAKGLFATFISSCVFFVVTNFAVWWGSSTYSQDLNGLLTCFALALPFFDETLTSTGLFLFTFEGLKKLAEWRLAAQTNKV